MNRYFFETFQQLLIFYDSFGQCKLLRDLMEKSKLYSRLLSNIARHKYLLFQLLIFHSGKYLTTLCKSLFLGHHSNATQNSSHVDIQLIIFSSQSAFTSPKSTIEILEQCVKSAQNQQYRNQKDVIDVLNSQGNIVLSLNNIAEQYCSDCLYC